MGINEISELKQLVVFQLENEEFGADINSVREIIRLPDITSVPTAPSTILGVINLRNETIPIISLRRLFGWEDIETDSETRILVVDADGRGIGLVVDSVVEVLRLEKTAFSDSPRSIGASATFYVESIAQVDKRMVLIVNMEHLVETGVEHDFDVDRAQAA